MKVLNMRIKSLIDNIKGYRGEVTMKFKRTYIHGTHFDIYKIGERMGQIIILPYPSIEFEEVQELSETERNSGGYGSTGE